MTAINEAGRPLEAGTVSRELDDGDSRSDAKTTAAAADRMKRIEEASTWFRELFAGSSGGRVWLSVGRAGGWPGAGLPDDPDWIERCSDPIPDDPDQRGALLDQLARDVVAESDYPGANVFAGVYRHRIGGRHDGAVLRQHVHADVDGPVDRGRARALGAMLVASGGIWTNPETGEVVDKTHAYLRLSKPVGVATHHALCKAFAEVIGGEFADGSKYGDGLVLRVPGTLHDKGLPDDPRPVRWIVPPDDPSVRTWAPENLARMLRVPWPVPSEPDADEVIATPPPKRHDDADIDQLDRRVDGAIRRVADAEPGDGNNSLNLAARICGALVAAHPNELAERSDEIQRRLVETYLGRPIPHGETVRSREREGLATIRSGWRSGVRDSEAVLADRRDHSDTARPRSVSKSAGNDEIEGPQTVDETSAPVTATEGRSSGEQKLTVIAPGVAVPEEDEQRFWQSRPWLAAVHRAARARMVAPWALFGAVLLRALAAVPHRVELPAVVVNTAPLNCFVALVGGSSAGKGGASGLAEQMLDVSGPGFMPFAVEPLGSGAGIAHVFGHREKGSRTNPRPGVVRDAYSAILDVGEIDTLAGLVGMKGSGGTLLAELRKAWSGEQLGFANADPQRRIPIDRHTYRLGLVAAVQPTRAGVLLDDADGGTPQRFLWLPAEDAAAEDTGASGELEPLTWRDPPWPATGRVLLDVCEEACRVIRTARVAAVRGQGDALDGHALLVRLKVAAALALLDNRLEVTEDDWALSGHVMAVSEATRSRVVRELGAAAARANVARGRAEGARHVVAEGEETAARVQATCSAVTRKLGAKAGAWMSSSALSRSIAERWRPYLEDATDALVASGVIEREEFVYHGQEGTRYRVAGSVTEGAGHEAG